MNICEFGENRLRNNINMSSSQTVSKKIFGEHHHEELVETIEIDMSFIYFEEQMGKILNSLNYRELEVNVIKKSKAGTVQGHGAKPNARHAFQPTAGSSDQGQLKRGECSTPPRA